VGVGKQRICVYDGILSRQRSRKWPHFDRCIRDLSIGGPVVVQVRHWEDSLTARIPADDNSGRSDKNGRLQRRLLNHPNRPKDMSVDPFVRRNVIGAIQNCTL